MVVLGLGQGTFLYESLAAFDHPLGIPYPDWYDYLSCVGFTPCWGWMNTNATVRAITQ